jgi:hypothetical protein
MGGRSVKHGSKGRIGETEIVQTSNDPKKVSLGQAELNYHRTIYPEFDKFMQRVESANSDSSEDKLLRAVGRSPEASAFTYWQRTEGQHIPIARGLKSDSVAPKYPELKDNRWISQKDIKKATKNALNAIYIGSSGVIEGQKASYQRLIEKIETANKFLKTGAVKDPESWWHGKDVNDPEVRAEAQTMSAFDELLNVGELNPIIYYWLENEADDLTEEEKIEWEGASQSWISLPEFLAMLPEGESFVGTRSTGDKGSTDALGSKGSYWDADKARFVKHTEVDAMKNTREFIVGNVKGMDDLKKLFKDGDKVRLVKLSDEDSDVEEHKDAMRIVHSLLFGEDPNSILIQAMVSAKRFSPDASREEQAIIEAKLADMSIVFDFQARTPEQTPATMQYSAQDNMIIIPMETMTRLFNAMTANDKETMADITTAAYHELSHAIHYATKGQAPKHTIADEFIADGFARMLLQVRQLNSTSFEQAKESSYDPIIRELLQDVIFQDTIPESLMSVDNVTRTPTLKDIQHLTDDQKEQTLQEMLEARSNAIDEMKQKIIDTAVTLGIASFFPEKANKTPDLAPYIHKAIEGQKIRQKMGDDGGRIVPVLSSEDREKLKQDALRDLDDPYLQDIQQQNMDRLQTLLYGTKIPPSIMASMQIIALDEGGAQVRADHLSRAKRALTKEVERVQKAMRQDLQDLETITRILFGIKKPDPQPDSK